MSPPVAAFVGAVFGGGFAAIVAMLLLAPRGDEVRPQAPTPVEPDAVLALQRDEAAPAAVVAGLPSLAGVEQRLTEIERKLEVLVSSSARTEVTPTLGAAVVDASSLQQALEEIERKKFESLSAPELQELAMRIGKAGDTAMALRAIDQLLARAKTPAERAAALHQKAVAHRVLGGEADLRESLRCLEQVVAENGPNSPAGIEASNQMVWTFNAQKNHGAALRQAESILQSSGANRQQRLWARWSIAVVSGSGGDAVRERSELEALLGDLGNDPEQEKLHHLVRERLSATRR